MPANRPPMRWPEGFVRGRANRRALLVLSSLRGLTPRKLLELAEREGAASACLAAVRSGRAGSEADQAYARELDPDAIEAGIVACGARVVIPGSEEYLPALEELTDPPAAVFVRGRRLTEFATRVAVVGARSCSDLGRDIAWNIGRGLGAAGVCVVSGAARGIDAAAHEGALELGGDTVAVFGCGIDQIYPPGSRSLIARIAEAGAIVSEYPPGVPPESFRFPARNRIVAALASAVVVVEGAAGSGSLISADHALELGRTVYAVPGAVNNPLAQVPLALIRDGAVMIRGAEDLLESLRLDVPGLEETRRVDLSTVEEAVLSHLKGPVLAESVARAMGLSIPEVVSLLLALELKGVIRSTGGRYEIRSPLRASP